MQDITVEKLVSIINSALCDTVTGPLSDSPYVDAVVGDEGMLFLYEFEYAPWPDATLDTPQLARMIFETLTGEQ